MQSRSGVATSKKKRSVYLARWSHSSSIRVDDFVFKVVTSVAPESNLALRKQFSVLWCRLFVKSRFMPYNHPSDRPKIAKVAPTMKRVRRRAAPDSRSAAPRIPIKARMRAPELRGGSATQLSLNHRPHHNRPSEACDVLRPVAVTGTALVVHRPTFLRT